MNEYIDEIISDLEESVCSWDNFTLSYIDLDTFNVIHLEYSHNDNISMNIDPQSKEAEIEIMDDDGVETIASTKISCKDLNQNFTEFEEAKERIIQQLKEMIEE